MLVENIDKKKNAYTNWLSSLQILSEGYFFFLAKRKQKKKKIYIYITTKEKEKTKCLN